MFASVVTDSLQIRYTECMPFLDNLNWRYATKKFSGDVVSPGDLLSILNAIRMAPSSAGTQPYHIVVVENPELKNQLITSTKQLDKMVCSHLLVFCSRTDFPQRGLDEVKVAAAAEGKSIEELSGLAASLDRIATSKSPADLEQWAARQAYIALGFALAACAELHIDSCAMEGFNPAEFHSILGLPDFIKPVVIMPIGHRDPNDQTQPSLRPKVRFPKEDLFETR